MLKRYNAFSGLLVQNMFGLIVQNMFGLIDVGIIAWNINVWAICARNTLGPFVYDGRIDKDCSSPL